jgi:RNA polymerase sigma-70 factor (ECF subfamily)
VPTGIEQLYREHRAGLVRLVERELHDHHEAEDVVQTAFLDAQRAIERGTIPRNPPAWLAAIALNAGRRLRRRRLNAQPLEDYAVQETSGLSELREALASLPREQQAAVLYRDLLGLSYGETAEQMGTSVNAVTMLLHRGRKRLRQSLAAGGVGVGVWRWLKHAGTPQVAMLKGAAAVAVGAGLATSGIVAARAVAPVGTHVTAESTARSVGPTMGAVRAPGGALPVDLTRAHLETTHESKPSPAVGSRPVSGGVTTPTPVRPSTAGALTTSPSSSLLRVPTVAVPTVTIPTLPATVAATVPVSTPITSATVTIPTGITATTPVTTVTVPLP